MKNPTKNLLALGLLLALSATAFGQRLEMPAPSPAASVMRTVGQTAVTIEYSSPGVKGREIWDQLVPYDKVWRTGANKATQFTTSHDILFGSDTLKAGTYALFTKPGKASWKVMFNTNTEQWGAGQYDEKLDAVTLTVKPKMVGESMERLTFHVHETGEGQGRVTLRWGKLSLSFDFQTMFKENMTAGIDNYLRGSVGAAWYDMARVAEMHVDYGLDLDAAEAVMEKSLALNGSHFFNRFVMGKVKAAQGDYETAYMHVTHSIKIAEKDYADAGFYTANKEAMMAAQKEYADKAGVSEKDYEKWLKKLEALQQEMAELKSAKG